MELERLDVATYAAMQAIETGDYMAGHVLVRISERRCRLLGLDAPTRSELTGKDGGALTFADLARRAAESPRSPGSEAV